MILIYNIGIFFYKAFIYIAARFNPKAKQWVEGRKDIFIQIENALKNRPKNASKTVWMHVASLGEFEQGRPLIEALKNSSDNYTIILTFFSPSGYEIRKNYPLADYVFYLPIDTPQNASQFIELIQPDLAIFVKYEFWFHYLNTLKNRQIPTILISAIFNKKQLSVYYPYSFLLKKMLNCFTHIFVQNTPSVFLLKKAGFSEISLAGDTRVDRVMSIAQEGKDFPIIEKFVSDSPTLICGSTWQPDEEIIMQILENQHFIHYKFIFAPHDISIKNIERLEKTLPIPSIRYSKYMENEIPIIGTESVNRVLIIDNIGMLSSLYRYGKIAYIGGGFGSGIHNTLEPIAFGLPVIFGKKYKKFEEANQLVETGGGFSIEDFNGFKSIMEDLNNDKNYRKASQASTQYIQNNKGATEKIMQYIAHHLNNI
jgi:3-deoxy-D-manno-octulosonic-acid transferase